MRAQANERLNGPDAPESLGYLHELLGQLHGRSGAGMNGLAPLTFETIESFCRLKDVQLNAFEIDALLLLDTILLYPEAIASDDADEVRPTPMPPPPDMPKGGRRRAQRSD